MPSWPSTLIEEQYPSIFHGIAHALVGPFNLQEIQESNQHVSRYAQDTVAIDDECAATLDRDDSRQNQAHATVFNVLLEKVPQLVKAKHPIDNLIRHDCRILETRVWPVCRLSVPDQHTLFLPFSRVDG